MKNKKGYFVVLEGGEGSGKTTLLKRIFSSNSFAGAVVTREPGGSPYSEEIRNIILNSGNAKQANALTMFYLFCAARADHLKNTIIPALEAGKIVICDRFDASTFAYQIFAQEAKELEPLFWEMRNYLLEKDKYAPDIYIYLDVNLALGLARKNKDQNDKQNHFDERNVKFHKDLRLGFEEFFKNVPHEIINANNSEDEVFNDFKNILTREVGKE